MGEQRHGWLDLDQRSAGMSESFSSPLPWHRSIPESPACYDIHHISANQ